MTDTQLDEMGTGGKNELSRLRDLVEKVRDVRNIQFRQRRVNEDDYMRGLANGLELAVAILESERQPNFIYPPGTPGRW